MLVTRTSISGAYPDPFQPATSAQQRIQVTFLVSYMLSFLVAFLAAQTFFILRLPRSFQ